MELDCPLFELLGVEGSNLLKAALHRECANGEGWRVGEALELFNEGYERLASLLNYVGTGQGIVHVFEAYQLHGFGIAVPRKVPSNGGGEG